MAQEKPLLFLSALEQAELIRQKALSPVELAERCLEQIEQTDGALNAWIQVEPECVMAEARVAEQEIASGHYRGPLHGLTFGVKDQMHADGFLTSMATRVLDPDEMQPGEQATLITRLREAGAILLGKQNLHEFGKGGTIEFAYGQPRNPWNPERTPSGSSSGSGIATVAGQCSFSIGEDTGGSVRGPASCNGIVGLRPTHGLISRHGGIMHAYTSDTFGPMGRSVADVAAVLQVGAGHDPKDPLSLRHPVPDYQRDLAGGVKGLRMAVVSEMARADHTDLEVRAAFEAAVETLRGEGAIVEEISLPLARWAVPLQLLTADADVAAQFLNGYLRDRYERFDIGTRTRLAASSLIPASVYSRAMRARAVVRREVLAATCQYDALLTPTNVTPPKSIEATQEKVGGDHDVVSRLIERRICHYPFSLANVPALSVPCGFAKDGDVPVALQIAGRPLSEATVLRIGHCYEQATEWHQRYPSMDWITAAP